MNYYELTYLISSEIKEEDIKKLSEEINSFIQKEQGVITKSERPFPETLAYPIKKQKTAFWVSSEFHLEPEKIEELRKKLKKETGILRFLIVSKKTPRKERVATKPAADETIFAPAPDKATAIKKAAVLASKAPEEQKKTEEKEKPEKKVELKEIEKKLEEILNE